MTSYKKKIEELRRQYDVARESVRREKKALIRLDDQQADCEDALEIIQAVAETIQEQTHKQIAHVVSRCLTAVFEEPYEFKIHFERKRNRTEVRLVLERDGLELDNPMDAAGGGVIDVAGFALRLSCLLLRRPAKRRLVVLDEPFRFLSVQYRLHIPTMLRCLAEEFDVQFLMVTHFEELETGKVIRV